MRRNTKQLFLGLLLIGLALFLGYQTLAGQQNRYTLDRITRNGCTFQVTADAQVIATGATCKSLQPPTSATLPATCSFGALYAKTGVNSGLYFCSAPNAWARVTTSANPPPDPSGKIRLTDFGAQCDNEASVNSAMTQAVNAILARDSNSGIIVIPAAWRCPANQYWRFNQTWTIGDAPNLVYSFISLEGEDNNTTLVFTGGAITAIRLWYNGNFVFRNFSLAHANNPRTGTGFELSGPANGSLSTCCGKFDSVKVSGFQDGWSTGVVTIAQADLVTFYDCQAQYCVNGWNIQGFNALNFGFFGSSASLNTGYAIRATTTGGALRVYDWISTANDQAEFFTSGFDAADIHGGRMESGKILTIQGNGGAFLSGVTQNTTGAERSVYSIDATQNLNFNSGLITNPIKVFAGRHTFNNVRWQVGADPTVKAVKPFGNFDLANPPTNIFDGYAANNGDLILFYWQTDPKQNGVYVFNGIGNAMTRPANLNDWQEVSGAQHRVENGTLFKGLVLWCSSGKTGTIGTSDIIYRVMLPSIVDVGDLSNVNIGTVFTQSGTALEYGVQDYLPNGSWTFDYIAGIANPYQAWQFSFNGQSVKRLTDFAADGSIYSGNVADYFKYNTWIVNQTSGAGLRALTLIEPAGSFSYFYSSPAYGEIYTFCNSGSATYSINTAPVLSGKCRRVQWQGYAPHGGNGWVIL